jgi:DNA invertase Pin-like site-specific DNA recombinase
MKKVAIYSRVSTSGQTVENQNREIIAVAERLGWDVVAILSDEGISGSKGRDKRPAYDKLMNMVSRREIDMIACWSVDRLGRSLQHLVSFLSEINDRHVDLYLHQQNIDTSTPSGKAMFGMLGIFAEFERSILRSRIMAGLRRTTKKSGRPSIDAHKHSEIEKLLQDGISMSNIAKQVNVGKATVHRISKTMRETAC